MLRIRTLRFAAIVLCLALPHMLFASIPNQVSFQGVLTTSAGQAVNATLQMTFKLYNVGSGGSALWTETQTVPVTNGNYQVMLGSITPITVPFDMPYFLGISVGGDAEMTPRQPLASAPYAFRAGCNPGDRLNCYSGPAGPLGNNCIMGLRTCNTDGLGWSACAGEVTPNCGPNCVNLQGDLANCGSCGNACATGANATPACTSGTCGLNCNAGFANCDNNLANGCEVNKLADINNCGNCGTHCLPGANVATAACSNGACGIGACNAGFKNCDGNAANGCEVNSNNDVNNCGNCNQQCAVVNGTAACASGVCSIGSCNAGFANCDNSYGTGCETNTNTSVNNCGTCGHQCVAANGTPACGNGTCQVASCNVGYLNCNGNANDGCECAGSVCCGASCATSHQNGLGQPYYDCGPLGIPGTASTYNLQMANSAAQAWTATGSVTNSTCGAASAVVKSNAASQCAVWIYTTSLAGRVLYTASSSCLCPDNTSPTWN